MTDNVWVTVVLPIVALLLGVAVVWRILSFLRSYREAMIPAKRLYEVKRK